MKRTLFVIMLICLPIWALADDYQTEYSKGQAAYKKGKYESAREHFMNVIEQKVYANVVSYIRLCNEKINEQYEKKIALLEKEKFSSGIEKDKKIQEVNNERSHQKTLLNDLKSQNKTILEDRDNLRQQLRDSTLLLGQKRHQIDSLQTIIANVKHNELEKAIKKIGKDNQKDNK